MDNFEKRGHYWYKVDGKHAYQTHNCDVCGTEHMARRDQPGLFCSKRCMQLGENNTRWKGDSAGYIAQHQRIYTARGKAVSCVWGCTSESYDWANLTGDYLDIWDFAAMCRSCHSSFDHAIKKMSDSTCKYGHTLNDRTMYKRFRNGKEVRQCKQCAKDRAKTRRQKS